MLENVDFKRPHLSKTDYKAPYKEAINELVVLQQQVRQAEIGLVVLFEGWAGAGKGSCISDLMYHLDARATSVHETAYLDEKDAKHWAKNAAGVNGVEPRMAEFWRNLGERGTITFFNRGWYTSAVEHELFDQYGQLGDIKVDKHGIVRVSHNGHNSKASHEHRYQDGFTGTVVDSSLQYAHNFEKMLVDSGYVVVKFFVHARRKEIKARMKAMEQNSATSWRVTPQKINALKHYQDQYRLYDRLLENTNFDFAPWTLINGEDRYDADLTIARTLVAALRNALAQEPDAATAAAMKKAEANSDTAPENAMENAAVVEKSTEPAESLSDINERNRQDEVQTAAIEEAKKQSALAPVQSRFPIVHDYPQLDHSKEYPRLNPRNYKKKLKKEQHRLATLELEMHKKGIPLIIMYEGWDAAGKGGNIKRVAQALDARAYTIFPSPAPTRPELLHPHLWRYWTRLPEAGKIGIYDRSWYGRVLVERIEGFATSQEWGRAYDEINEFERELVRWGALVIKFWVDVHPDEQLRRFEAREENPLKRWKITNDDWRNRDKYPQYFAAVNDMFRLTSTPFAPWYILESDDKLYARVKALEIINDSLEARLQR